MPSTAADWPAPDDFPGMLRAVSEQYPAAVRDLLVPLAEGLPPGEALELLDLVTALDTAVSRRTYDDAEDTWQRILAHLPGLAPALQLVHDHVVHLISPCAICAPEGEPQ